MTNQVIATVKSCFDNSKDGEFNYGIILSDETRLFYRGYELNPMPKKGDKIKYKIINTKTSGQGNPYSNVSSVEITNEQATEQSTSITSKNSTQRMDIFVTGVVGRAMGSGQFSQVDIKGLTRNAVEAFNENLKEL